MLSGLRSSTFLDEIAKMLPASRFTSQLSSLKSHVFFFHLFLMFLVPHFFDNWGDIEPEPANLDWTKWTKQVNSAIDPAEFPLKKTRFEVRT